MSILSLLISIISFIGLATNPVSAQELAPLNETPDRIWDVTHKTDLVNHTGGIRALVWDLHEYQGKMYVGGTFQTVLSPQGERHDQSFLAAFDLITGEWDPNFRPNLDNAIYSIEHTSDGRLIVGGEITGGMAAIDPVTGATLAGFNPEIINSWGNPAVFDIEVVGDTLYVGGSYSSAQNVALTSVARFSAIDGSLDSNWIPSLQKYDGPNRRGNAVHGIDVDTERGRIYIAGKFGSVDNVGSYETALQQPRSDFFAVLDPQTAELKEGLSHGFPVSVASYQNTSNRLWDVQAEGDRVYIGGKPHQAVTMNAEDLKPLNAYYTRAISGLDVASGGDNQAIEIGDQYVWASCHCWGSVGEYELGSYAPLGDRMSIAQYKIFTTDFSNGLTNNTQRVKAIYGFNKQTGELLPLEFDLRGQGGGWALNEDSNGRLWVGGQFTSGGGRALYGLTRFSPPTQVGSNIESCNIERDGTDIEISWSGESNPDSYVIKRSVDNGPWYWRNRVPGESRNTTDSDRSGSLEYQIVPKNGNNLGEEVICEELTILDPVPTDLRSTRTTKERIVLNWKANSTVEISRDGQVIATDSDGWYTDKGLSSNTVYEYKIRYLGSQEWSEDLSVSTLA